MRVYAITQDRPGFPLTSAGAAAANFVLEGIGAGAASGFTSSITEQVLKGGCEGISWTEVARSTSVGAVFGGLAPSLAAGTADDFGRIVVPHGLFVGASHLKGKGLQSLVGGLFGADVTATGAAISAWSSHGE